MLSKINGHELAALVALCIIVVAVLAALHVAIPGALAGLLPYLVGGAAVQSFPAPGRGA